MTGRHLPERRSHLSYLAVLAVVGCSAALLMHVMTSSASSSPANRLPLTRSPIGTSSRPSSPANPSPHRSTTGSTAPRTAARPTTVAPPSAITALIAAAARGGVSVTAYDTVSGRRMTAGATSGMLTASVAKVELLETMLLEHQDSHTPLSSYDTAEATTMIENSNDDAAQEIFDLDGYRATIAAHEATLGLSDETTVLGPTGYWGLTTTSSGQQIALLRNLIEPDSPLDAASRAYALQLMENVESDQRWGVPAAADAHTGYAVKNGWLSVDDDNGLWAVNSVGIITVRGQRLLISVLTQHDRDFNAGIALVEKLAAAAAAAVTS